MYSKEMAQCQEHFGIEKIVPLWMVGGTRTIFVLQGMVFPESVLLIN